MKNRTSLFWLLTIILCLGATAISYGQEVVQDNAPLAQQVLEKYRATLQREDIQEILPAVLEGLKAPNIQALLTPQTITLVVTQPDLLTQFVPGIDPDFITLLKTDAELQTMLQDAQVQALLQDPAAIDELAAALVDDTRDDGEGDRDAPVVVEPVVSDAEPEEGPADAIVSISPSPVASPAAGGTLKINIQIRNGRGIAGYELTVEFDTSALTYVAAANATYLPAGAFAPAPRVSGNRVTLTAAAGSATTNSSGTLATVTFRVGAAKASTLSLQNVLLTSINGQNLPVTTENGQVTKSSGAAWDVNQDGTVNVSDLVLVARSLGSRAPANPRVDVNSDGQVNVSDLVLVARHLGETPGTGTVTPPAIVTQPTPPKGMVLIPAGTFQMGSNFADEEAEDWNADWFRDEQPVHTVHLDAFYMDVYEVTNAQFKAFVDANPQWQKDNIDAKFHDNTYLKLWSGNNYPSGEANHPVTSVPWYAAMAYAQWAGKRLPTEAEWEYAARGGLAGQNYPWGDTITLADANYGVWDDEENFVEGVGDTTPVGSYPANGYGLYDMAGNVEEWCLDAYDAHFYAVSDNSRNPIAGGETIQGLRDNFPSIPTGSFRVLRDGDFYETAQYLRVANRGGRSPASTSYDLGFRCARAVTP